MQYGPLVREAFQRIANGELTAVTSVVTLSESLVRPLTLGDVAPQDEYRKLLQLSEHVDTKPIDSSAAESAAGLWARYGMRLPDAMQLAVALEADCQAFLTSEAVSPYLPGLRQGVRGPSVGAVR